MKNPIVITLILIVLVVVASAVAISLENEESSEDNSTSSVSQEETTENNTQPNMENNAIDSTSSDTNENENTNSTPGLYINYDTEALTEETNILFFYASWCPTCNSLDRELNLTLSDIPSNVTILKVRYDSASGASDEEIELKRKYGVTYQHTLVQVDKDGNQINKWNGSRDLNEILSEIN